MSFSINARKANDVVILDVSGRLTLGEPTAQLRDQVHKLVDEGNRKIVLNLSELQFMDSAGLGELVGAYTTVTRAGGKLKLLKVGGKPLGLLEMTKLITVFDIFEDEAAAAADFK